MNYNYMMTAYEIHLPSLHVIWYELRTVSCMIHLPKHTPDDLSPIMN